MPSKPSPAADRRKRFVAAYLRLGNGTQAAIEAGYSPKTAYSQANRLLKDAEVRRAIDAAQDRALERAEITKAYVLDGLKEVAERCMQRVPVMQKVDGELVQVTNEKGEGVWEFDSAGANRAFELLGKHLKLFTDKVLIDPQSVVQVITGIPHGPGQGTS